MEEKHLTFKHRLALGATMGLFMTMSFLVFGPLSLYINGSDEMWFSFRSLIVPVVVVSLIGFVMVTAVATLFKGAIHKLFCCLVFGVSLGLFIQGGFFNISYGSGVLDGSQIAWKDYTTYGAIDSAMWAACIALPFAFYMVFKRSWRHILMFAAAFIMIMQIGALSLMLYQNQNSLNKLSHEVTREGIYELSQEDNTVVFVLGDMDAADFKRYCKNNKSATDALEGFTRFDNTLATGSGSIVSFPSLLSGDVYRKDIRYADYIDKIWDNSVFDTLSREGVDARVYADELYFSNDAVSTVENVVDRVQDKSVYKPIAKTIYKYTLYNFAPHYLKKLFWMNINEFSAYRSNNTYSQDDAKFFSEYDENGGYTYTDRYDSAVRVYFLKGAYTPYRLTQDGTADSDGTTRQDQVAGVFNRVLLMLDDMKQSGHYTDARIIITADNGARDLGQNPLLLYKESGDDEGYTTSDAPISLFDIAPTLASVATNQYYTFGSGKTIADASKMTDERIRYFYLNAGSNSDSRIEQYKCTDTASNTEALTLMNNYLINGGVVENYRLGDEMMFTTDETAAIYCEEGFGHTNGWRTILRGPKGKMVIPFESIPENADDLHVYFNVSSVYENTRCVISANGRTVYDHTLDPSVKSTGLNFLVPANVIGLDNKLTLEFSFPDIDSGELEDEVEQRTPIVSFTSFKIYTQ